MSTEPAPKDAASTAIQDAPPAPVGPQTKVSCCSRFKNIARNNYRGLLGFFVPIIVLPFILSKKPVMVVLSVWIWMFWTFLSIPVATPVTGLIPVFMFPAFGIMSSNAVCGCFFNDMIALMLVGGWVAMALNNSGCDRRIILWLLTSGSSELSIMRLLLRSSLAAYLLSMFCRNIMVTMHIIKYVAPALINLRDSSTEGLNYNEIRYIICCAIFTSSAIGSTAILNASFPTLSAAGIWSLSQPGSKHNVFNFFDYSLFAFPTSLLMFIVNLIYNLVALKIITKKEMSLESRKLLTAEIRLHRKELPPKVSLYEIYSLLAVFVSMAAYFSRRNRHFGWARDNYDIKDATVAAMCCVVFHILPKDFNFIRIFCAKKQSQIYTKPAVGWLLFKFVDKNTDYGYLILMGCGIALNQAVRMSNLDEELIRTCSKHITSLPWVAATLVITVIIVMLSNVMPGTAAVIVFLPFIIGSDLKKVYLVAVAIGIGGSLGFILPFQATPAYHCRKHGKVPIKKMVQYGILSSLLCMLVLWLSLSFLAEKVWGKIDVPL